MKKEEKNRVTTKVLAYENPVFWKLEEDKNNPDVLESSISYFKEHGIVVSRISLSGRPPHYYAVWNAKSKEEAREANRKLEKDEKEFFRRVMPMLQRETSLDALHEKGYGSDGKKHAERTGKSTDRDYNRTKGNPHCFGWECD